MRDGRKDGAAYRIGLQVDVGLYAHTCVYKQEETVFLVMIMMIMIWFFETEFLCPGTGFCRPVLK